MNKSLLFRSIFTVMVMVVMLAPQGTYADAKNITGDMSQTTLVKDGHLTICKLDKTSYVTVKTMKMVVTAYTNIPELTDDSPNITASNKEVEYGMVATNLFKFGTKVRIPDVFGDQIFVVEDRMNSKYNGKPHMDVFLPSYKEAKAFGYEITNVEILES